MYALFGDNDFVARIYPAALGVIMVMMPFLFRRWRQVGCAAGVGRAAGLAVAALLQPLHS